MKNTSAVVLVSSLVCFGVCAAEPSFLAKEFQVEAFGTARAVDLTGKLEYGTGIGASYYITRGFGLGVRTYIDDVYGKVIDAGEARILLRAPLWHRIAPYGYLNGRYGFTGSEWSAGSGGGLEYRFTQKLGAFAEVGFQVDTLGKGKPEGALGIRWTF